MSFSEVNMSGLDYMNETVSDLSVFWQDFPSCVPPADTELWLRVDVSGIYAGNACGRYDDLRDEFIIGLPSGVRCSDIPGWPQEESRVRSGVQVLKSEIVIGKDCVQSWRMNFR